MSRKTQEAKQAQAREWKRLLRFRRWTLSSLMLLSVLCLVGSQGPWYQSYVGDTAFGDPKWGTDFSWDTRSNEFDTTLSKIEDGTIAAIGTAEAPSLLQDDLAEDTPVYSPSFWERPGFHAQAALWCCLGVLFFAGYNLASNATLDWPLLVTTGLLSAVVITAFYALSVAPSTLRRVIEDIARAGEPVAAGGGDDATGIAGVDSRTVEGLLAAVSMRFSWGTALMGAATPLLVLQSLLLTFFLKRKP